MWFHLRESLNILGSLVHERNISLVKLYLQGVRDKGIEGRADSAFCCPWTRILCLVFQHLKNLLSTFIFHMIIVSTWTVPWRYNLYCCSLAGFPWLKWIVICTNDKWNIEDHESSSFKLRFPFGPFIRQGWVSTRCSRHDETNKQKQHWVSRPHILPSWA